MILNLHGTCNSEKQGEHVMVYTGEHLRKLIFPLGGIGTGSIGLAGNGACKKRTVRNALTSAGKLL